MGLAKPDNVFEYECPDGTRFTAQFPPGANKMKLELDGVGYELPQVQSGSGIRYSDGTTTFWGKGREAMLERKGHPPRTNCKTDK